MASAYPVDRTSADERVASMTEANDNASEGQGESPFSALLAECPQLWAVVDRFVRAAPDQAAALEAALRDQSFDRLRALAGVLRQAGAGHGGEAIASRAAAIEQAAHDHLVDGLAANIDELNDLIADLRTRLHHPDG